MKVGIISDIHGNSDAFEAVLNAAKKDNVEKLLILGDIVGYYYYPEIVLSLLGGWGYEIIKGNHENILADLLKKNVDAETIRLKYGSGHQLALNKLTASQIEFLIGLPEKKTVLIEGISFLMCHGSPWDSDYYIYPDADKADLDKCNSAEHDFVLIGHTHYPFWHRNGNSVLINPGSVGQSRQVGGVASWAVVNTNNNGFELKTTPYNTEKLKKEVLLQDPAISYLYNVLNRK